MPTGKCGQKPLDHHEIIRIIDDQKPVCGACKPLLYAIKDALTLLQIDIRKCEQFCHVCKAGNKVPLRLGSHPEYGLILTAMTIGIRDSRLGFPKSTQASQCPRRYRARKSFRGEAIKELFDQLISTRKSGRVTIGHVPYRGKGAVLF